MDGSKLMGTRRSKHNRGRKPFYKDHDHTTLADIAPVEAHGWEEEAEQFLHDRHANSFAEARYRPTRGYLATRIGKPDPELTASVKAYLAKRRAEQARLEAAAVFPDVRRSPERVISTFDFTREADHVEPSHRDILMEMFVERKITHGQIYAGRRWQADKERAAIQPSRSIEWSNPGVPYQARGDLTGSQWAAMKRRSSFVAAEGIAMATFLDFCLEADRGRSELVQMTGITAVSLECAIEDMLTKLCRHFGRWRRGSP